MIRDNKIWSAVSLAGGALLGAALAVTTFASAASAETSFICIQEQVTGFRYINNRWERANFTPDMRFLVNIRNDTSAVVTRFGGGSEKECFIYQSTVTCQDPFGIFRMDISTQRFLETYNRGYIDGDETDNTPTVSIGTCAAM
jgi:hypothetical protein